MRLYIRILVHTRTYTASPFFRDIYFALGGSSKISNSLLSIFFSCEIRPNSNDKHNSVCRCCETNKKMCIYHTTIEANYIYVFLLSKEGRWNFISTKLCPCVCSTYKLCKITSISNSYTHEYDRSIVFNRRRRKKCLNVGTATPNCSHT